MKTWLSKCLQIVSSWMRELGSAHVVDDGLGGPEEAAKRQVHKPALAPRRMH
ncbi:hypothetical protein GGQ73_000158 [Rhizobium skierniewicense]|uniref:Uncharacterized protein n=1 Tax=Rhizobium skierniewicense TaxID=984260 RepID=A0A7W6C9A5_9HYPH|nr:hypothetical protein [Rhizobium skierniewicense]MBB3944235.1 hypothetical protein [Rhizobium skierniewicense]